MARDILSEYGRDSRQPQAARATSGGCTECKELPYSPPQGPTTFSHQGPGLANADNYGTCGTQGRYSTGAKSSGSPGLGGQNSGIRNRPR